MYICDDIYKNIGSHGGERDWMSGGYLVLLG